MAPAPLTYAELSGQVERAVSTLNDGSGPE